MRCACQNAVALPRAIHARTTCSWNMPIQSTIIACSTQGPRAAACTACCVSAAQALLQMLSQAPAAQSTRRRCGAVSGGGTYHGGQAFRTDGWASTGIHIAKGRQCVCAGTYSSAQSLLPPFAHRRTLGRQHEDTHNGTISVITLPSPVLATAADFCHCAGSDPMAHHSTLPLMTADNATVNAFHPSTERQQGSMSSLPPAPPLSLGTFGQHSPQHQVHPYVKSADTPCTAGACL